MIYRSQGKSALRFGRLLLGAVCIVFLPWAQAGQEQRSDADAPRYLPEPQWGMVMAYRHLWHWGSEGKSWSDDILPLFFYEGDTLYLRGDYGGLKLLESSLLSLNLMAAYRLMDRPSVDEPNYSGNSVDPGVALEYRRMREQLLQLEWLSDKHGASYANFNFRHRFSLNEWQLASRYSLRYRGNRFSERYLPSDGGDGALNPWDLHVSVEARLPLYEQFYLFSRLGLTQYGLSDFGEQREAELLIGLGLFRQSAARYNRVVKNHFLRLGYGVGSLSTISEIATLNNRSDPYDNRLHSVTYGIPVANRLFDWPLDLYLTPSLIWHLRSDVQGEFPEYVLAMKGFYCFDWQVSWRLGLGVGLSYSDKISWVEQTQMQSQGYQPSHLMQNLDLSADINLGSLFKTPELRPLWLGYGLHHRSGVFGQSSTFGQIKGGSNYHLWYLQWHW